VPDFAPPAPYFTRRRYSDIEVAPFKTGGGVGTDVNRYAIALVSVFAVVALAGCGTPGGTGTPTQSPANQSDTTVDGPYDLPLNGTAIRERHRGVLTDAGSFSFRQDTVVRAAASGALLQYTNVSAQVDRSSGVYRLLENGTTTPPTAVYVDENDTAYLRERSAGQIAYDRQSGAGGNTDAYLYPEINRYIRGLNFSYEGTETTNGATVHVYAANGTDRLDPDEHGLTFLDPASLSALSAELRVAADGSLRSFRYDVTSGPRQNGRLRYVVDIEYAGVGSTTVGEPSWLGEAKNVTSE
jgi:hypothetical protein